MIDLKESQTALCNALLESRQRWQDFGAIAADFAFETDGAGRFTFVTPETVLGWSAPDLLGHPAADLLAGPVGVDTDPFQAATPVRQRQTWLRRAQGGFANIAISAIPLLDGMGRVTGTRGVGVETTDRQGAESRVAAALHRGKVLDHILSEIRHEIQSPRMMESALAALLNALGAEGVAVIDVRDGAPAPVLHAVGADPARMPGIVRTMVTGAEPSCVFHPPSGHHVMACPASTRFGDHAALVAWRRSQAWEPDDGTLAISVSGVIRIVLEHEAIQLYLARQARTDSLTGLLIRRSFLDEAARRIDRLDREELPGTMMCLELEGMAALNGRAGREAADAALVCTATLLRRIFRPTDLVARLGGERFGLWLDGSDELTAAERAESLRAAIPAELADVAGPDHCITVAIGIACRAPSTHEELDPILQRALHALDVAKSSGGGAWHVSHRMFPG